VKFAATRPARRRLAAGALAATALLGVTGCSAVSPIATGIVYSASDGVNGTQKDMVDYRNLALIGAGDSGPARLIGMLKNPTDQAKTYTLSAEGGSTATVEVGPNASVTLEDQETVLERQGVWAGENLPVTLAADGQEVALELPILAATQEHYRDLLPAGVTPSEEELQGHLHEESLHYGGEGH